MLRLLRGRNQASRDVQRLEALSDGVIAIAITLLVFNIRVPEAGQIATNQDIWSSFTDNWAQLLAYVISFSVIGIVWANHYHAFHLIGEADHFLILLNLALLICIGAIPITTELVTEHLGEPGEQAAALVYSGWFLLTSVVFIGLWRYALSRPNLLIEDRTEAECRVITRRLSYAPVIAIAAICIAFISPNLSLGVWLILLGIYVAPP
jgi:uncharacterized membrane protein